jgi:hypothetical protein
MAAAQAAAAARKAQQDREIDVCRELYPQIAAANGLRAGVTDQEMPIIAGDHQGVACSVGIVLDAQEWAHTVASAKPIEQQAFKIAVAPSPRGALGFLKQFFSHSIKVGDDAFDEAFLVHATPPERASELLSAPIREALTAMVGHGLTSFTVEPEGVVLQWNAVEQSEVAILAAIDLVTTAARFRIIEKQPYR